jgi:hypothetical protein
MQMHGALRQAQGGSAVDVLATSCNVSPEQARAVMRAVAPEFAWALETRSLNRGALADLVELIGHVDKAGYLGGGNFINDEAARRDGNRVLVLLLGPGDARAMLTTDVARRTGVSEAAVAAMLPGLAVLTVASLAGRSENSLGALLARMPALGPWSKGSPHADLADILRRRCGGGPYASRKLRRVVRNLIGRAGGFGSLGVIGWYVRFMLLRPAGRMARPILGRVMPHEV